MATIKCGLFFCPFQPKRKRKNGKFRHFSFSDFRLLPPFTPLDTTGKRLPWPMGNPRLISISDSSPTGSRRSRPINVIPNSKGKRPGKKAIDAGAIGISEGRGEIDGKDRVDARARDAEVHVAIGINEVEATGSVALNRAANEATVVRAGAVADIRRGRAPGNLANRWSSPVYNSIFCPSHALWLRSGRRCSHRSWPTRCSL